MPQIVTRTCVVCGIEYPAGGYRQHRQAVPHRHHLAGSTNYVRPHIERDAAIVAALDADPYTTLDMVAAQHGITRERVRQIYKRETHRGARRRPKVNRPKTCAICRAEYFGSHDDHSRLSDHGPSEKEYLRNRAWEEHYVQDRLSSVQIARIYGVAPTAVVAVLNQRGVKMKRKPGPGDYQVRKTDVRLD